MLEEIRRRSEEAELKRIEEEDEAVVPEPVAPEEPPEPTPTSRPSSPPPVPPPEEAPFEPPAPRGFSPFPVPEPAAGSLSAEEQQRALILKEKFLIAIDRRKPEKASEILSELNLILPHEEVLELREKLHQLEEEAPRGKGKKRQAEPPPPAKSAPAQEPPKKDLRKKIPEMLEAVNNAYQQEKYESALRGIEEILKIDAENDDALRLKQEIVRAQQLAEQIAKEDEKRRKEEAAARSALKKTERRSGRIASEHRSGMQVQDKDVWGSSVTSSTDSLDIDIAPEEKGPAAPPKPPVLDRIAERVARVKVPVKPLLIAFAVIAAVVIGYFVVDNIRNAVSPPLYSILVFPPTVNPADSALQAVAEGLTVDLAQDLSAVSDLRVVGASTAFALDASTMGNLQRCRAVTANFFFRWSLGKQGESLVLQTDLFDTTSAKSLWTSRKISTVRELPRLKTEIAHALVAAMSVRVSDEEQRMLRETQTSNEYAYAAYLRARSMMRHPDLYPISAVIQTLEQAVVADSSFGRAQSALGWAHMLAYESGDRVQGHLAEARVRVQRAVSLVLRNPEAYRVWGALEFAQGQYDKAVERYEQAVAIAPSDAESQCRLACAYLLKDEPEAALKAANRAVVDDPWVVDTRTILAQVQHFLAIAHGGSREEYKTALRSYEEAMKFAPDRSEYGSTHIADLLVIAQQPERALNVVLDRLARDRQSYRDLYVLGRVGQSAGKPKADWQDAFVRAKELLKAVVASRPDDAVAYSRLALVHSRLGEFRDAVAANQRALKLAPADPIILYNTARMYSIQNDKQQAKEFLAKAVDRSYSLQDILDIDLSNVQTEPDFVKIVTR